MFLVSYVRMILFACLACSLTTCNVSVASAHRHLSRHYFEVEAKTTHRDIGDNHPAHAWEDASSCERRLTNPGKVLTTLIVSLHRFAFAWGEYTSQRKFTTDNARQDPKPSVCLRKARHQSCIGSQYYMQLRRTRPRIAVSVMSVQGEMEANEITSIRINKALRATHSRRAADKLVIEGRVTVNGEVAQLGDRLSRGDVVRLNCENIDWERLNLPEAKQGTEVEEGNSAFTYIKFWKRRGVICTTDQRKRDNIIEAVGAVKGASGLADRLFPVGRLDVDSSGLILLTSDGSIVNRLLRKSETKRKEYLVVVNRRPSDQEISDLANGVVITTVAQRDGKKAEPLIAPTLPCVVQRTGGSAGSELRFVLTEGRNRQIRRMCDALDLEVVSLHRVGFSGVTLDGLRPGMWKHLSHAELGLIGVAQPQSIPEEVEVVVHTEEELMKHTVIELKAMCRERGLKVGGVKKVLIERLLN